MPAGGARIVPGRQAKSGTQSIPLSTVLRDPVKDQRKSARTFVRALESFSKSVPGLLMYFDRLLDLFPFGDLPMPFSPDPLLTIPTPRTAHPDRMRMRFSRFDHPRRLLRHRRPFHHHHRPFRFRRNNHLRLRMRMRFRRDHDLPPRRPASRHHDATAHRHGQDHTGRQPHANLRNCSLHTVTLPVFGSPEKTRLKDSMCPVAGRRQQRQDNRRANAPAVFDILIDGRADCPSNTRQRRHRYGPR